VNRGLAPQVECCEPEGGQLSVHVTTIEHAYPLAQAAAPVPSGRHVAAHVNLALRLYRCVESFGPAGSGPPDASTIDRAAQRLLADEWCLVTGLYARVLGSGGDADPLFGACQGVRIGRTSTLPAEGGCVGFEMAVQVFLDDGT
jgi:hypothetical protein